MTLRAYAIAVAVLIASVVVNPPGSWSARAQASDPAAPHAPAPAIIAAPPPKTPEKTIEEITVTGTQEKVIHAFVDVYAAPVNSLIGQLARWKIGVCPLTYGLFPSGNALVSARIKEVAAAVGAPVDTTTPCKTNLRVVFTRHPQEFMDVVKKKAQWLLGSHYRRQTNELATVKDPIQAWYATATADRTGALTMDDIGDIGGGCTFSMPSQFSGGTDPAGRAIVGGPPVEITASSCASVNGSRISEGFHSEFRVVTVVVDNNKVRKTDVRAAADYVAMVALSQTKSFSTCLALPSILNLMNADCEPEKTAKALTPNDMAYLSGLYQMNIGLNASLAKNNLAAWMKIKLNEPNKEEPHK